MNITITKTTAPKAKPASDSLGFGQYFTDHMFICDYIGGQWRDAKIIPYGPLSLDPSTMVLHYGQAMFEGMKAYRTKDGRIMMFRPELNFKRANISNERLGIPQFDEKFMLDALCELIRLDKDWVPAGDGTSLYIRPFIIATDPFLGVRRSNTYKFIIICSPSGMYYKGGLTPVKIYVEDEYVRAVRGGIGYTKTPGNYAASIKAQMQAQEKGYSQVLWLDGVEQKYIEEVGAMNVFFVIGDTKGSPPEVVTPQLNGSILSGITRMSVIELLTKWGIKVSERKLSIDEIVAAADAGTLKEAFGTGTAAVISPMGELNFRGKEIKVGDGNIGEITGKLYDKITGIQTGRLADDMGWVYTVSPAGGGGN